MNYRNLAAVLLSLPILAACTSLAPIYTRPAAPIAVAYPDAAPPNHVGEPAPLWPDFFSDPALQKIIGIALANNRDLRVAVLNIEQARALYRIQEAQRLPHLSAVANGSASRSPADLSPTGQAGISRQYSSTLSLSAYELDLFGRIKSLSDQAVEQYLASAENRRATQISLVAEVAASWLQLAADMEHLAYARQTAKTQGDAYQLTERRVEIGSASNLTLRQQQFSVETARADVARYSGLVARDRNALTLLLGMPLPDQLAPGRLKATLDSLAPLPVGMPSSLLQRRPDILAAEHLLKAANANIGAARAAFYPQISLTGAFGTASRDLSNLFHNGSTWNFAPQISLPIFDGGGNRYNLRYAEVARDIRVAQYEKSIQAAFREVADALAEREAVASQIEAQGALVMAASEALMLSDARFSRGYDSYLQVLDAQRTLYSSQQTLIDAELAQSSNAVTLYRALGGGWWDPSSATRKQ